jgi:hypothetical protein
MSTMMASSMMDADYDVSAATTKDSVWQNHFQSAMWGDVIAFLSITNAIKCSSDTTMDGVHVSRLVNP